MEGTACAKDIRQERARQAWTAERRTVWLELGTWAKQQDKSSSGQSGDVFLRRRCQNFEIEGGRGGFKHEATILPSYRLILL